MRRRGAQSHPVKDMDLFKGSGNECWGPGSWAGFFYIQQWLALLYTDTDMRAWVHALPLSLCVSLFNTFTHHSCHFTCWYILFLCGWSCYRSKILSMWLCVFLNLKSTVMVLSGGNDHFLSHDPENSFFIIFFIFLLLHKYVKIGQQINE